MWFDNIKENVDKNQIEEEFYILRQKEHDINTRFKHVVCPNIKRLIKSSDEETDKYLKTNHLKEFLMVTTPERRPPQPTRPLPPRPRPPQPQPPRPPKRSVPNKPTQPPPPRQPERER